MGGWFQLFEFNQGSMARKIFAHKKHDAGLEAPRNSLELQSDASQGYYPARHVPYSYQLEDEWPGRNNCLTEASVKKLISEEVSKQSSCRQNAPGIVARLMGMDELPLDTKPIVQQDRLQFNSSKREKILKVSSAHLSFDSNHSNQMDLVDKSGKPKRREHPQEEELQKFKKEFEAWQAARFRECSKVVEELGGISGWSLSQEKSNGEKLCHDANFGRTTTAKPAEPKHLTSKESSYEAGSLRHHRHNSDFFRHEREEFSSSRSRTISKDFGPSSPMGYSQNLDAASTKIVILKPGPDRICNHEESWTRSSGTLEDGGSMEDFLDEVKERLKMEVQGKTLKRSLNHVRGTGIETPFSEKPSDPKQIAKHIAKQVRDNATRDLGMNLLRSESTRSYRSEIQFNGPDSLEFISRDMRRLLSERLRNVLKQETLMDVPAAVSSSSRPSVVDNGPDRLQQIPKSGNKQSFWEIENDEEDTQTRSFRHGDDDGVLNREMSPKNLIRSLSAPVSGTSFGKLLLEDRHVLTGAQIRRKHEGIETLPIDVRKRKKEKFSFKEKVSNIKYSFILRRRLFGKKIQSMVDLPNTDNGPVENIMSGPTVLMNFGERPENSTEVPPSPASVCSGTQEEYWRQVDHNSLASTPDINFGEDCAFPQVFKEISSNFSELRRQLNELESGETEDFHVELEPAEPEKMDLEDETEAYVRDLLIASGLYDGSTQRSLSQWGPLGKPVSNAIFDEVEESYKKFAKEKDSIKNDSGKVVDHKMLLELLNEALSTLLGSPVTSSRFMRRHIASRLLPPLHGRKLLDSIWEIMRVCLYPPTDRSCHSLEYMVAKDLRSIPWFRLMDDEVNILGREVECQIIGELLEEIVEDMH